MNKLPLIGAIACAVLAGCGGGSGSPPPSVTLALSTAAVSRDLSAGDEIDVPVTGTWSGQNLAGGPVYLSVRDAAGKFSAPTAQLLSAGPQFQVTVHTMADSPAGTHTGNLEVRACKDEQCATVYANGTASLAYTLRVAAVADWETHQRDAAHRGYVPITLKPANFKYAWQWQRASSGEPIGGLNAVVTAGGKVYVTTDVYFGEGTLYALAEADGSEAWRRSMGTVPAFNPPAVSNGRVYAAVSGHEDTALWAFDAGTGTFLSKAGFSGQWPHLMAPTPYRNQVYTGAGYYGGETYAFSTDTGTRAWTNSSGGVWDMFTPAVDDNFVYHYNGLALYLIDPKTGATTASISDPFGKNADVSYHGSPAIGGRKNVIAFSGGAFSGRASSNVEQYDQRVISSFNIDTRIFEWASGSAYLTAPAIAKGVIYAARNSPMSLDAIDEATGKVLWSWIPSGTDSTSFHRNIVVTDNLLFVGTDKAVFALDLATKAPVWSYPKPGMLAISAGRTLYIVTGATASDGGLVAIKLK